MGVNDDIKKDAKDKIIGYLKEKRKNGTLVEERTIYSDMKKEKNLGIIEVMGGIRLIKDDIKNGGKDVEITQRQGFVYYKYVGQLDQA